MLFVLFLLGSYPCRVPTECASYHRILVNYVEFVMALLGHFLVSSIVMNFHIIACSSAKLSGSVCGVVFSSISPRYTKHGPIIARSVP